MTFDSDLDSKGEDDPPPPPRSDQPHSTVGTRDLVAQIADPEVRTVVSTTVGLMEAMSNDMSGDAPLTEQSTARILAIQQSRAGLHEYGSAESCTGIEDPLLCEDVSDESVWMSLFAGCFSRAYADEAHMLRNRSSATNLSVRMATFAFTLFVSANPAPNRLTDFLAFLEMIERKDIGDAGFYSTLSRADILAIYKDENIPGDLKLSMNLFKGLYADDSRALAHARDVLPIILGLCQLKRCVGQKISIGTQEKPDHVTIGSDIPHYRVFNSFIVPRPVERLQLAQTFESHTPSLVRDRASKIPRASDKTPCAVDDAGTADPHLVRRFIQASFCPALEDVSRWLGSKSNVDGALQQTHDQDHGKRSCPGCG